MTGGRLLRAHHFLKDEEIFCLTYGDGLSNVDINAVINFHKGHGRLATLTATYPPARFGALVLGSDGKVKNFEEKPMGDGSMINGGFFVLSPKVFDYLEGDETVWEQTPLKGLASDGELMAYQHRGFWQPMDTLRDKQYLENLWDAGEAPWKLWS